MKTINSVRQYQTHNTPGYWCSEDKQFTANSLELAWRENQPDVSCIPEGEYICRLLFSPRFGRKVYHVLNVEGRENIEIHPGNFADSDDAKKSQTEGCIILGLYFKDLNGDGITEITKSADTVQALQDYTNGEDFRLVITSAGKETT